MLNVRIFLGTRILDTELQPIIKLYERHIFRYGYYDSCSKL